MKKQLLSLDPDPWAVLAAFADVVCEGHEHLVFVLEDQVYICGYTRHGEPFVLWLGRLKSGG